MADDRDRPRAKKSWREIDQTRGKGRTSSDRPEPRPNSAQAAAQKSYRAALERAFEAGTLAELAKTISRPEEPRTPRPAPVPQPSADGTPAVAAAAPEAPAPAPPDPAQAAQAADRENRMKLIARIKEAEGRDVITRAIDAFLARYPKLPDDFEVLTKALSHKDDERIVVTLAAIETLLGKEKPRRARTLQGQLRFLEETHSDPEIRTRAAAVRARL
jgi:hypothetical protein